MSTPFLTGHRYLIALGVALLTGAAIFGYLLIQPSEYQARVALVPHPVMYGSAQQQGDYPAVVSANLPAVVELVKNPAVLTLASRDAGVSFDPGLVGRTTAEVVPASSLVRVTVAANQPEEAQRLVVAIANRLTISNFLAGVARLERVDAGVPLARKSEPDSRLARGLGLLGGVLAGITALATESALSGRLQSRRRALETIGERSIAFVELDEHGSEDEIFLLLCAGGVRIMPVGRVRADVIERLTTSLRGAHLSESRLPWILVVDYVGTTIAQLGNALRLLDRRGETVLAVVVAAPRISPLSDALTRYRKRPTTPVSESS